MKRTIGCGDLRPRHIGEHHVLAGWVHRQRDHGGLVFIDLRDRSGVVQLVADPQHAAGAHAAAAACRSEFVVLARGAVRRRPAGTENPALATGEVEVLVDELIIENPSLTPPFPITDDAIADESLRLRYRYLDLRRPRMARNLVLRHRVVKFMRDYLDARGFIEVETPILIKSTPEGARDYLVPSRLHPGTFYALPQSPQQLKQLLMVAGVERYFQIARCFRDEDLRADRQPEFTQLDLEMSFVDQDDILNLVEGLYTELVEALTTKRVPRPFPRFTFAEVMDRYGSDKPDLRYGMEIVDLSAPLAQTEFRAFRTVLENGGRVRGIAAPGAGGFTRRQLDELVTLAQAQGANGLAWMVPGSEGPRSSGFARVMAQGELAAIVEGTGAKPGDLVLLVADEGRKASQVLGALRVELARRLDLLDRGQMAFAWVTDFPLLEWNADEGRWDSTHHPFTAPHPADVGLLDSDPGAVRAQAYDLICNGYELGSGSIRIHRRDVQQRIFRLLNYTEEEIEARFGHLLRAFQYGAPPHGGIAPGVDRLVMLLADEENLREVIAFPKNQSAVDLMTGAPSPVSEQQLRELSLRLAVPPGEREG